MKCVQTVECAEGMKSLPAGGAWIEIRKRKYMMLLGKVAPRRGSVD